MADPDFLYTGPEAFCGFMGITCALVFASIFNYETLFKINIDIGSAYGTMKSSVGICSIGVNKPDKILTSIVPVIMAGILGVYGLIVGVILLTKGFSISSFFHYFNSWYKGIY
jgi:V-type H+-transporting ATPase proteolipid subunit